jgi:hypothetical protein
LTAAHIDGSGKSSSMIITARPDEDEDEDDTIGAPSTATSTTAETAPDSERPLPDLKETKVHTIGQLMAYIKEALRQGVKPDCGFQISTGADLVTATVHFLPDEGPENPPHMLVEWMPDRKDIPTIYDVEDYKNLIAQAVVDTIKFEGDERGWRKKLVKWIKKHPLEIQDTGNEGWPLIGDMASLRDYIGHLLVLLKKDGIDVPEQVLPAAEAPTTACDD